MTMRITKFLKSAGSLDDSDKSSFNKKDFRMIDFSSDRTDLIRISYPNF